MSNEDLLHELEGYIVKLRTQAQLNRERGYPCSATTRDCIADDLERHVFKWSAWAIEAGETERAA